MAANNDAQVQLDFVFGCLFLARLKTRSLSRGLAALPSCVLLLVCFRCLVKACVLRAEAPLVENQERLPFCVADMLWSDRAMVFQEKTNRRQRLLGRIRSPTPPCSAPECLAACWPSQSSQSAREVADDGNLSVEHPHGHSSRAAKEAAGDVNGDAGAAGGGGGGNGATTTSTLPANPGAHHFSPPDREGAGAAEPAAAGWGAGLSEQVQTVLNYGRAKVNGVVTRYSHLQHVQVRLSVATYRRTGGGAERRRGEAQPTGR